MNGVRMKLDTIYLIKSLKIFVLCKEVFSISLEHIYKFRKLFSADNEDNNINLKSFLSYLLS